LLLGLVNHVTGWVVLYKVIIQRSGWIKQAGWELLPAWFILPC
jgi:hypothetical protein